MLNIVSARVTLLCKLWRHWAKIVVSHCSSTGISIFYEWLKIDHVRIITSILYKVIAIRYDGGYYLLVGYFNHFYVHRVSTYNHVIRRWIRRPQKKFNKSKNHKRPYLSLLDPPPVTPLQNVLMYCILPTGETDDAVEFR